MSHIFYSMYAYTLHLDYDADLFKDGQKTGDSNRCMDQKWILFKKTKNIGKIGVAKMIWRNESECGKPKIDKGNRKPFLFFLSMFVIKFEQKNLYSGCDPESN